MATDDQPTSTPPVIKRPGSRQHRILTQSQTIGSNRISKLPSLLSKSSVFLSSSETTNYKRYRSQPKDILNTSTPSKIDRQTTNITAPTRLPPLNPPANDHNPKQRSEYQRRQIYALNHLMRELEQEQFQQFCKLNGTASENSEEIVSNDDDPNKQPATSDNIQ